MQHHVPKLSFPEIHSNIGTPETRNILAKLGDYLIQSYDDFVISETESISAPHSFADIPLSDQILKIQSINRSIMHERFQIIQSYESYVNDIQTRNIKNWVDAKLNADNRNVEITFVPADLHMTYDTIPTDPRYLLRECDCMQFCSLGLRDGVAISDISDDFDKIPSAINASLNSISMGFASDIISKLTQSLGLYIEITVDNSVIFDDIIDRFPYEGFPKSCLFVNMMTFSPIHMNIYKFDQYGHKQNINDMLHVTMKYITLTGVNKSAFRKSQLYDPVYNLFLQNMSSISDTYIKKNRFPTYPSSAFAHRNTEQSDLTDYWRSRMVYGSSVEKYEFPNEQFSEALAALEKTLIFKMYSS